MDQVDQLDQAQTEQPQKKIYDFDFSLKPRENGFVIKISATYVCWLLLLLSINFVIIAVKYPVGEMILEFYKKLF